MPADAADGMRIGLLLILVGCAPIRPISITPGFRGGFPIKCPTSLDPTGASLGVGFVIGGLDEARKISDCDLMLSDRERFEADLV